MFDFSLPESMFCNFKIISRSAFLCNALQTFKIYLYNIRLYTTRNSSTKATPLDEFTNLLVKEKSIKFIRTARQQNISLNPLKTYGVNLIELSENSKIDVNIDIKNLSTAHIDNLLLNALDEKDNNDIDSILRQCNKYKRLPTISVFLEITSYYSRLGLKEDVAKLHNLLSQINPQESQHNAELMHFYAEISWVQGNIEEAVQTFLWLYDKYEYLRPKILEMSLYMISELVSKGSDANLVMMTNFANSLFDNYNDLEPLIKIWELTFFSEWYSDQVWSNKLLEENQELLDKVKNRFIPIAVYALHKHQINIVHRILENLLAHNLKRLYIQLLHLLFDYKCSQNDLRGCTEIMNVALAQGIPMRGSHQVKLLQLLLGKNIPKTDSATNLSVPKYVMKF